MHCREGISYTGGSPSILRLLSGAGNTAATPGAAGRVTHKSSAQGLDKGDCRRFWCIDANLFVILFSPPQLRASSVLYLFVYFKGICYKNFSLMATFS